ncbi:MAG: energy transducer TonB [Marinagarivorans sp.]
MNDEQLTQLFAAQNIPAPTDAAKAAAITAAMAAFAEQPPQAAPLEQQEANFTAAAVNKFHKHKPRYGLNSIAARFYGVLTVAGLHAAVVLAFMIGLAPKNEMVLLDSVKVEAVEELNEEMAPPPPPPPDYAPPPPDFAPPPSFNVAADAPAPANAITTAPVPAEPAPVAIRAPTPARPNKKGLAPPTYPSESKKLGEEGIVALALYLNEEGRVQDAKVETSSGFARLDDAAVKQAVKAWKFEPCTEEGKPVACWYKIKFRFLLKDAH